MLLRQIFDPKLAQYSYLIGCPRSGHALVVDPQRDVDRYFDLARAEGLELIAAAETHIHADFLSGARELCGQTGMRIYLSGEGGPDWLYAWPSAEEANDVVFLSHGDSFSIGSVGLKALHTPGHTPEHLCFLVTDRGSGATTPLGLLSGDCVLVGDAGRPDLLEMAGGAAGSRVSAAEALHRSLRSFGDLEDHLLLWPGHGSGSSCGKSIGAVPVSTVGYEKRHNDALRAAQGAAEDFVDSILADQPTPPSYFGRMKQENRDGPSLLRRLPRPRRLGSLELPQIVSHSETVVLDGRRDRSDFMRGHLPGSLHTPFDRSFSTTVGALIVEPARPLVLLIDPEEVDDAVRDLVRIGCDLVVGWFETSALAEYLRAGGERGAIPEIRFDEVARLRRTGRHTIVDVREVGEHAEGHIPDAVNAPHVRLPEYVGDRIPPGRPLIVHCESGVRSAVASAWLAAQGREVLYVDDNWSEWIAGGEDVANGRAPAAGTDPN